MATSKRPELPFKGSVALSLAITLSLLVLTDFILGKTQSFPPRLPEHFSSSYLDRFVRQVHDKKTLLVLGDSVLWGYGVKAQDSAVAILRRRYPGIRIVNAAYEAGTPINIDFLVRYMLQKKIRPQAVLFDLNPIAFSQLAKSYNTLNPALEHLAVPALLEPFDATRLKTTGAAGDSSLSGRLDSFVERHWLLYAQRVDIHQAIFGDADAASALSRRLILSPAPQEDAAGPPAYDLTPLGPQNVSFAYTRHLLRLLSKNHVAVTAFLTPTDHQLLREYVDVGPYDENLQRLEQLVRAEHVTILNLDRQIPSNEFIDYMHLTKSGNAKLARLLMPEVGRTLNVF